MKHSFLIICILILFVIVCGCTINSNTTKDVLPTDKYVAVLEEYTNTSTLIGNTTYSPVQPMPIPTPRPIFYYNNSQGMSSYLKSYGINVNDNFKILLGKISYIDTPTEVGYKGMTQTGEYVPLYTLTGIYTLPYTIENEFTILNITQNGTIIAIYKNQTIYLQSGENRTFIIHSENITGFYLANTVNTNIYDFKNITELPWPIHNEISITITNKGIFNKSILMS